MKRAWMAVPILVVIGAPAGCKKAEPPSPIVKKVEDAGSGDLSQASARSISDWFNKHQDLAKEIKKECSQVQKFEVCKLARHNRGSRVQCGYLVNHDGK